MSGRSSTVFGELIVAIVPDPDVSAAVAQWGRTALAWEVLRRDPAYVAAFVRLAPASAPGAAATPAFVARWGAHFP